MIFFVPMLMALLLSAAAMSILGVFALHESKLMSVFYEDTGDYRR